MEFFQNVGMRGAVVYPSEALIKDFRATQEQKEEYLFSINIDTELEGELNKTKGNIPKKLKKKFKDVGYKLSENASINKKEKENEWAIINEKIYIARKEYGKLNIYK